MFVEGPVRIESPLGELELGVADAEVPGVAEGVSRLLHRSIQDARAEAGGHLPSWLVDDIERNYISPEKVRTLWAATGHRFALRRAGEIVGTIHVAKSDRTILTVDRTILNVDESEHPGFKPPRHHHVVNISVLHELRRARLGTLMVDGIVRHFRHLFSGVGLWVRADPPWHPGLAGLGFVHDPALDVFLPASVERTADLPHPVFNQRYACTCRPRRPELDTHKLQYVSMTRLFEPSAPRPRVASAPPLTPEMLQDCGPRSSTADVTRPASVEAVANVLAWASREGRQVTIRGRGQSYDGQSLGDDVVLATERLAGVRVISRDRVTVAGGTTWRALLAELATWNAASGETRYPPVVPSWLESSIGGTLASRLGGIGKGSLRHGRVTDDVESLLVVTRDGRRVECTRKQAGWLFEAALSSEGRAGVIVEATLCLVERPRLVTRSRRDADASELADVLADPALEHASAELVGDRRLRVLCTRRADAPDAALPVLEHLVPPVAEPERPRAVASAVLSATELASFDFAHAPPRQIRVHPRLDRASGAIVFVVQTSTPAGHD